MDSKPVYDFDVKVGPGGTPKYHRPALDSDRLRMIAHFLSEVVDPVLVGVAKQIGINYEGGNDMQDDLYRIANELDDNNGLA